jgi:cephalosporin hydroxylase
MQELIWSNRPDVIVECGIAHGGSTIFYASILELIGHGRVIGVDVEIRQHNRLKIESHSLSDRITLIEGDSVSANTLGQVRSLIDPEHQVMVTLDSNHTYDHVLNELELYAPLVTVGQYVVVFDGVMRILHDAPNGSTAWRADNPGEAAKKFLASHNEFEVDRGYERVGATYCPGGFLRRLR